MCPAEHAQREAIADGEEGSKRQNTLVKTDLGLLSQLCIRLLRLRLRLLLLLLQVRPGGAAGAAARAEAARGRAVVQLQTGTERVRQTCWLGGSAF